MLPSTPCPHSHFSWLLPALGDSSLCIGGYVLAFCSAPTLHQPPPNTVCASGFHHLFKPLVSHCHPSEKDPDPSSLLEASLSPSQPSTRSLSALCKAPQRRVPRWTQTGPLPGARADCDPIMPDHSSVKNWADFSFPSTTNSALSLSPPLPGDERSHGILLSYK